MNNVSHTGRVFVTGDTHGEIDLFKLSSKGFPDGKTLTRDDYVIIAGDFGVLWSNRPDSTEKYLLAWLAAKPWTTLFIDGNHENFTRLQDLPSVEMFGNKVGVVNDTTFHLRRGEVYTIAGKRIFCFGGAKSTDRAYRIEGKTWWPEEEPNYIETDYGLQSLEQVGYEVDYIITHNGPATIIKMMNLLWSGVNDDPICKYFDHVISATKFRGYFFGHHHADVEQGKFRCLYKNIVELI